MVEEVREVRREPGYLQELEGEEEEFEVDMLLREFQTSGCIIIFIFEWREERKEGDCSSRDWK